MPIVEVTKTHAARIELTPAYREQLEGQLERPASKQAKATAEVFLNPARRATVIRGQQYTLLDSAMNANGEFRVHPREASTVHKALLLDSKHVRNVL